MPYLGNELLLMPVFVGVGALVRRVVPGRQRAVVQGALVVTAAVTVVALPLVLGFGFRADIPSALPRNYLGGFLLILGLVWLVAAVLLLRRLLGRRVGGTRRFGAAARHFGAAARRFGATSRRPGGSGRRHGVSGGGPAARGGGDVPNPGEGHRSRH